MIPIFLELAFTQSATYLNLQGSFVRGAEYMAISVTPIWYSVSLTLHWNQCLGHRYCWHSSWDRLSAILKSWKRENLLLPLPASGFSRLSFAFSCIAPISGSVWHPLVLCVSMFLLFLSLIKTLVFKSHLGNQSDLSLRFLITSAQTLLTNKVTFHTFKGLRNRNILGCLGSSVG